MKMYNVINYVDCTPEQLKEILALRNMDDVRVWMVNSEIISEESHFRFVENLRGNVDRLFFAIYENEMLVGTYNLNNIGNGIWERGIIANPLTQGRGITGQWERQILHSLSDYGIKIVSAKVKLNNRRSIRYHEKLGYLEQGRDDEFIYYILKLK